MNKCPKCGTEFEGNFCPQCGTKHEEKKFCPECGAELDGEVKFCSLCGYNFFAEEQNAATEAEKQTDEAEEQAAVTEEREVQQTENQNTTPTQSAAKSAIQNKNVISKLYSVMRILPSILIAVFSVLSMLFFLADVGSTSAMGESEGLGSLYKVLGSGPDEIRPVMAIMLVFNILALAFSVVAILFTFHPLKRLKTLNMSNKKIRIDAVFSGLACVLLIIIFIISCVACGVIGGLGNSAGDFGSMFGIGVSPAAGVILVLVFSILFAIVSVLCIVGRFMLAKKEPTLAEEENAAFEAKAEKKKEAAKANSASQQEPSKELSAQEQMRVLTYVKMLVRHLKTLQFTLLVLISFVFPAAIILLFVAPFVGLGAKYDNWNPTMLEAQRKSLKKYAIGYAVLATIMTVFIIVFEVMLFPLFTLMMGLPPTFGWVYGLLGGVAWALALTFILAFVLCLVTYPVLFKLENTFYSTKKPSTVLLTPNYNIDEFYVTKAKIEQKEIVCRKPLPDFVRLAHLALFILLVFIVVFVHIVSGRDFIFNSTRYVEKISIGDSSYVMTNALGRYDDYYEISKSNFRYEYYSENFRTVNYQIEQLNTQLENASLDEQIKIYEQLEKLEKEIGNLDYKFIAIEGGKASSGSSSSMVVQSVALVASVKTYYSMFIEPADENIYTVSKIELRPISKSGSSRLSQYEARVWFTDGSYHASYVSPLITQNDKGAKYKLSWTDSFFRVRIEYDTNSL